MSSGPHNQDEPLSDINVTPFVDVLLVLLIIFMITAPIIHQVVKVDLPQDSYREDGSSLDSTLRVVIDRNGIIYINKDRIGPQLEGPQLAEFQQRLTEWMRDRPAPWYVDLAADEAVAYGRLIPVITRLKEMNIGLNLVIEPKGS